MVGHAHTPSVVLSVIVLYTLIQLNKRLYRQTLCYRPTCILILQSLCSNTGVRVPQLSLKTGVRVTYHYPRCHGHDRVQFRSFHWVWLCTFFLQISCSICLFRWPWVTPDPGFKDTVVLKGEYLQSDASVARVCQRQLAFLVLYKPSWDQWRACHAVHYDRQWL